jgi:hypothetical protein
MLPLIQRILAIVGEMLGIVQQVLGITQTAAQEHTKYAIETIASNGTNVLIHPTYGNSALKTMLDTITSNQSTILTAINSIRTSQGGGDTVILPTTPPAGYGGASSSSIASAVWAFQLLNSLEELRTADSALTEILAVTDANQRTSTYPVVGTSHFVIFTNRNYLYHWSTGITPPAPDYSDIRSTDTVLSWLTRTETTHSPWQADAGTGLCFTTDVPGSEYQYQLWCTLTTPELLMLGGFVGPTPGRSAPVWPGIANVTLGTPVIIADGASSSEACDGVIVAITGVPTGQGAYTFDTQKSYVHLGQLAFIDDNGEYEDGQNFGFQAGIITPRRMAHAAGFVMRVKASVTGTVTPWVNA